MEYDKQKMQYEPGRLQGQRLYPCRGMYLRTEEIDRERALSGWNPYEGEEEPVQPRAGMRDEMPAMQDVAMRPYPRMWDYAEVLGEEQEMEQDLRRMQAMCPESAKILIPYIEEACDKMEYEGSPMYMEHPDRETVLRISGEIAVQVQGQFPPSEPQEPDEIRSMQWDDRRRRPGQNWPEEMIRTMLLHEMHRRRCRHGRCRRWSR